VSEERATGRGFEAPVKHESFDSWFIHTWFRALVRLVTWWKRW
jgi:hypothetical protein